MTIIYRMGRLSKQIVKSSGVDSNKPEVSDCFDDNCNGTFDEEPVLNVVYTYCDLLSDINPIENRGDYSPGELDDRMDLDSFDGIKINVTIPMEDCMGLYENYSGNKLLYPGMGNKLDMYYK